MRLSAHNSGNGPWTVIHVPTCTELKAVIWADDGTHQYEYYLQHSAWCLCTNIVQAKKINIFMDKNLVLIDPLDDEDMMAPGTEELDEWVAEDFHIY